MTAISTSASNITAQRSRGVAKSTAKLVTVPDWVFGFTDEQFIHWCRQHKLVVCDGVRAFGDDERAAIFRYAARQQLVN